MSETGAVDTDGDVVRLSLGLINDPSRGDGLGVLEWSKRRHVVVAELSFAPVEYEDNVERRSVA